MPSDRLTPTAHGSFDGGVLELGRAFRSGALRPSEFAATTLERIERIDPELGSVVSIAPDVMDRARAMDARIKAGDAEPLVGIPFGVKDVFDRAGMRTTGGSSGWPDGPAVTSAAVVDRLESAGAVFVAKLTTPELNCGKPLNDMLGATRHPENPRLWAGGSSSGSAAAVAAGLLPFTLGEDSVGSIRMPAAHCGVVGLRPTHGALPTAGGIPVAWSFDQPGPLTSDVAGTAAVMNVLRGRSGSPLPASLEPRGLTLGVARDWFQDLLDPAVERSFVAAVGLLERAGCRIREITLPSARHSTAASWLIVRSEFATFARNNPAVLERTETRTRELVGIGSMIPAVEYIAAQRARTSAQREYVDCFDHVDLIITPTTPSTAGYIADGEAYVEIDGQRYGWSESVRTVAHFSYVGVPALTVPIQRSDVDGLPVGMQVAGLPHQEDHLFAFGLLLERIVREAV